MSDRITISIEGMHCDGCETKIRKALVNLEPVSEASVSSKEGSAEIHTSGDISDEAVRDAVAGAGNYRVSEIHRNKSAATEPHASPSQGSESGDTPKESLYPLFLIVGFIAGVTLLVAWSTGDWQIQPMMLHFMAGFFIVFSFFKLLDPPGFVSAYRGYDLIARRVPAWGWAYPFVELALGVSYLMAWSPMMTNIVTLVLMLVGAAGVLKALLDKKAIRCACLGTALNLPMTKVTLVEDLTMAVMAGIMLLIVA